MCSEIWKDCVGYEGKYQASNQGKVYSLVRKQFKQLRYDKDGYLRVGLVDKNGKIITEHVHRLVAKAFLEQPKGKNIVNHLNSIRDDNRVENLEWTDASGNMKHAEKQGNLAHQKATEASRAITTKKYNVYKNGKYIGSYMGREQTALALGIDKKTIYNSIRNNKPTRKGYSFTIGGD